jgi:hypothetical protein
MGRRRTGWSIGFSCKKWLPKFCFAALLVSFPALAVTGQCFDFSSAIPPQPLHAAPPLPATGVVYEEGTQENGVQWGYARGRVDLGMREMLSWLTDHRNWKDPDRVEMKTQELPSPHALAFHRLELDVHIFAFIHIGWVEEWYYSLLGGTAQDPTAFLVSYQKVEGSDHVRRLCGSVVIRKLTPTQSDAYFYEETDADHYGTGDIHGLNVAHFEKLTKLAHPDKTPSGS